MSVQLYVKRLKSAMASVLAKNLLGVALVVIMIFAFSVWRDNYEATKAHHEDLRLRSNEVSRLLAQQLGGSIKFGNVKAIAETVEDVIRQAQPDAVAGLAFSVDGDVLHNTPTDAFDMAAATELARTAIAQGELVESPGGEMTAVPAKFGADRSVVGAVVTVWTRAPGAMELAVYVASANPQ